VYGEEMGETTLPGSAAGLPFAGEGQAAVRKIRTVLAQGGFFCTYPDFVYSGHPSVPVRLFGVSRPMSAGYVALIARPGTLILPAAVLRNQDAFVLHCQEPFQVTTCPNPAWRSSFRQQLAEQCAMQLEALIRLEPAQWLLLNTLTFESPQMVPNS
jgi:lauroyl/myristoyl acyltransferase